MKSLFKLFTKEIIRPYPVPEYIIFNVSNFNNWFNAIDNGATYAHSGIYLRLDKLSESHIYEYIKLCYGIERDSVEYEKIRKFYEKIRERWVMELNDK